MLEKLYKYPVLNIIITLVITGIFAYGLTKIEIKSDMADMLSKDNQVYKDNKKIKDIYGGNDALFIGLESKNGNIVTVDNLHSINELTKKIENIVPLSSHEDKKEEEASVQESSLADYDSLLESIQSESDSPDLITDQSNTENITVVDNVQSITNIELIEGVAGGLEPVSLEDYIPQNESELKLFKEKLLSWDFFKGILYSDDFKTSAITVTFGAQSTDDDQAYVYKQIKKMVKEIKNDDLKIYVSGQPVVVALIIDYVKRDLMTLIPIVVLVLAFILYLSLSSIRNMLLPLVTVCIATIWTIGIMGFIGMTLGIVDVVVPVLLIAIGSAYGIHIITHYLEEKNNNKISNKEENKKNMLTTVKNVIIPVSLAAVTTFFGFISLASMGVNDIKRFGIFVAIGVIIELVISIVFIPSVMMVLKPKEDKGNKDNVKKVGELSFFEKILLQSAKSLRNKKIYVIIGFAILVAILLNGAVRVNINFDTLKFFKKNSDIVKSSNFMDKNLSGSDVIFMNIIGKEDGDLARPEILKAMDDLSIYLVKKYDEVGKVVGFNDMIKRMNKVMHYPDSEEYKGMLRTSITYEDFLVLINSLNHSADNISPEFEEIIESINRKFNYNGEEFNEIPINPEKYGITARDVSLYAIENNIKTDEMSENEKNEIKMLIIKRLISQYLLLYSGNMDELIAEDPLSPRMARLNITVKQVESSKLKKITDDIKEYTSKYFPAGYEIEFGGTAMLTNELNNIIINGQFMSFILAILIVFIIISISYKSIFAGLIGIIPISVSILVNFAVMGYFNLDLNLATSLIASVSVGIGIDYAIHFLSFYKKHWQEYKNIDKALEATFCTSGKAILYNALSVGLGFAVLIFSSTRILGTFGILITLIMLSSSVGALTIIPIILEMFKPKFIEK